MEQLPFDDAGFDAVAGFNSFQYAANPVNALREARRVVRPDGRVAIAVWGRETGNQAIQAQMQAIGALLPPPPPGAPGPFALSADGALAALVRDAGLMPVRQAFVICPWTFSGLELAITALTASGPAVRAMQLAGEEPIRAAVASTLSPYRLANGSYRLETEFTYLIATA